MTSDEQMNAQRIFAYYWSERERVGHCEVDVEMMSTLVAALAAQEQIVTAARHLWKVENSRHDFPTWSDALDALGAALNALPRASEGE